MTTDHHQREKAMKDTQELTATVHLSGGNYSPVEFQVRIHDLPDYVIKQLLVRNSCRSR
jgi:hypothetical protein